MISIFVFRVEIPFSVSPPCVAAGQFPNISKPTPAARKKEKEERKKEREKREEREREEREKKRERKRRSATTILRLQVSAEQNPPTVLRKKEKTHNLKKHHGFA